MIDAVPASNPNTSTIAQPFRNAEPSTATRNAVQTSLRTAEIRPCSHSHSGARPHGDDKNPTDSQSHLITCKPTGRYLRNTNLQIKHLSTGPIPVSKKSQPSLSTQRQHTPPISPRYPFQTFTSDDLLPSSGSKCRSPATLPFVREAVTPWAGRPVAVSLRAD